MQKNEDRRRFPRFTISQAIEIGLNKEEFFTASVENVSEEGILIKSAKLLELQSKIYFLLQIKKNQPDTSIECEGIVIHSDKARDKWLYGIHLTSFSKNGKKKYLEFVKSLA